MFQSGKKTGRKDRLSLEQSHLHLGDSLRRYRFLTVAALLGTLLASAGCAAEPPAPSEKVAAYYDEHKTLPTKSVGPVVAFIGDSYTFGTGANNRLNRWSTQVSEALGWSEYNFGKGGTGYVSISQQCSGPCTNYAGSIKDVQAVNPAIVVVTGIRNDASLPAGVLDPAIGDFYDALRLALPDAKIVALSPIWDAAKPPERVNVIGQNIKAAVESVHGSYVDIGQPLEGHADFLAPDGVHPNDAGYAAITTAVKAKL